MTKKNQLVWCRVCGTQAKFAEVKKAGGCTKPECEGVLEDIFIWSPKGAEHMMAPES